MEPTCTTCKDAGGIDDVDEDGCHILSLCPDCPPMTDADLNTLMDAWERYYDSGVDLPHER
jgi:hypothetical protein